MQHDPVRVEETGRAAVCFPRHLRQSLRLQQPEVVIAGESRDLEVILDDEDGHLFVGWNHDWSERSLSRICSVTAFLADECEPGPEEGALQCPPVDRSQPGHVQATS